MTCSQKSPPCQSPPAFRYTWPGRDEAFVCAVHAVGLSRVASGMGLRLQQIPLSWTEKAEEKP